MKNQLFYFILFILFIGCSDCRIKLFEPVVRDKIQSPQDLLLSMQGRLEQRHLSRTTQPVAAPVMLSWQEIQRAVSSEVPSSDPFYLPFRQHGVFFAHFSKSGGTTFKATLKQYLAHHNLTWCANKLQASPPVTPRSMEMCGSHDRTDELLLRGGVRAQDQPRRRFSTVIMLRDPIDRLISEYGWFYRYQGHRGAPLGDADPFLKYQLLQPHQQEKLRAEVFADLVKQLRQGSSSTLCTFLGRESRGGGGGGGGGANCSEEEFQRATKVMLSYDLVLSTTHFDESVVLFAYKHLLPEKEKALSLNGSLHYVKRKVVSKTLKQSDLTPEMIQQLKDLLQKDYSLYLLGMQRFQSALTTMKRINPISEQVLMHYQTDQLQHNSVLCLQDDTAKFKTCL